MPKVKRNDSKRTNPVWAQDQLDRHTMIQGGSFLEKPEFTLPNPDGYNIVYSGTLVGRTYTEKETGVGYGPADVANDEQIYLLIHDVDFDDEFLGEDGQCSLYRWGSQVREESLPDWGTYTAAEKAKIRELYEVVWRLPITHYLLPITHYLLNLHL